MPEVYSWQSQHLNLSLKRGSYSHLKRHAHSSFGNRVIWISLLGKMIFEQHLKERPGQTKRFSMGKVFQAEGVASAKALK